MRLFLLAALLLATCQIHAQDAKKEAQEVKTKMDIFTSKTGIITKFVDYKLPPIKTSFGASSETRIRKVSSGTIPPVYFYQIEKESKYTTSVASIEYADLLEVIKAIASLKSEVDKDVASKSDYLENKFTTVDGFQVGYYVGADGAPKWYLKLSRYGSDQTLFVDGLSTIETAFDGAKAKIDSVKGK
ncbi:hypothetical protein [Fibrella aestuarina]|uniref:hypothetical protein n=1 Tax=Fibrella aestuarina TaxID=651143 RepID=UPI00059BDE74|nr:hypothetical protein [Fibrella aestuarina]